MSVTYVVADLVRNPRRTLSTMVGVVLGVGLFCGVLFFVDGLSASMTQRAVAPLPIDMQRIVTERAAARLDLAQTVSSSTVGVVDVTLDIRNPGDTPANEVTVRSVPVAGLGFIDGSAQLDGTVIPGTGNLLAQGAARAGYNLGTLQPGARRRITYQLDATGTATVDGIAVASSYSSRESVNPVAADQPAAIGLDELALQIARRPGVAHAATLSIADLGADALRSGERSATGPTKIFGLDDGYAQRDETIVMVDGGLSIRGAVLSVEAADALGIEVGASVTIELPDGSDVDLVVAGIADLSRSRSLFSSRRGGDLETFLYVRNAVIVPPRTFADDVFPAFERAVSAGDGRLKSPPIREIDVTLEREVLDADPATAVGQTELIAADVMAVAEHQDYLLDNISNTLHVAADDAAVAKRLFVFLGVPGGLLAAMLAAYAGNVLAEGQRREHAILRIRGASRRHLLRMLAARTAILTGVGSVGGLTAGYVAALVILGRGSLGRASFGSLLTSAVVGMLGGFLATGAALYVTGRRSIDREINEDRAQLASQTPLWRRAGLDIVGALVIAIGTGWALRTHAFDGASGSVYFGRSVQLNLRLLVLPVAVWITGSLLAARIIGAVLHRTRPASTPRVDPIGRSLLRRSIGRRPWAVGNGAVVAALIVALATSLTTFTASYATAKIADARYANGADIRVTPSPTADRADGVSEGAEFVTPSMSAITPVIYGLSNVVLRSARTSDPANLVAVDPDTFTAVAPVDLTTGELVRTISAAGGEVLLSADMAAFLKAEPGDTLNVLLSRATPDQVEIELTIAGLFDRLPGFPDGADAVMHIDMHAQAVPTKAPDFFLASIGAGDDAVLATAVSELRAGPGDDVQIDTRASMLDRDQSSLAALNIAGLVALDSVFALAMAVVAIAIFVFGLLLQRRREYVTLRAQGLEPRVIRLLIGAEAAAVAATGTIAGLLVGAGMGYYFVAVLRPLFVLDPRYIVPIASLGLPVLLVALATTASALLGSRLVNSLDPTELLRDE